MRSPWTDLLFMHGYIADPQLARRLAADAAEDALLAQDPAPLSHGEAMRRLIDRGRRLSLRVCQGIGSGLVHMQ